MADLNTQRGVTENLDTIDLDSRDAVAFDQAKPLKKRLLESTTCFIQEVLKTSRHGNLQYILKSADLFNTERLRDNTPENQITSLFILIKMLKFLKSTWNHSTLKNKPFV